MSDVLQAMIQLPTGILSIFMVIILTYWLFVILGALDIDMFDGVFAATDGGAEAGAEAAAEAGVESLMQTAGGLSLRSAPITIVFSFLVFYAWILSLILTDLASGWASPWLIGVATSVVSCGASLFLTSLSIRPLIPIFESDHAPKRKDFIGEVCIISTGKVTQTFGQATVVKGDLLIQVRCDKGDDAFKRGDRGLIIDFDEDVEAFLVEPLDPMMYG